MLYYSQKGGKPLEEIAVDLKIIIGKEEKAMLKKIQDKTNVDHQIIIKALCLSGFNERMRLLFSLLNL